MPIPSPDASTKPKSQGVEGLRAKRKRRNISWAHLVQPRASLLNKELEEVWTRFLIVKRVTGSFKTVSPLKIDFDTRSCVGKVNNIPKTYDGSLLIEAMNKDQVPKLVEIKTLCEYEVIIVPHGQLNTCRGVVSCKDLAYRTDEELCTGMKDSRVIAAKRFTLMFNGNRVAIGSFLLTFNGSELPKFVIPAPIRCCKCLKFGHVQTRCRFEHEICECGKKSHEGSSCITPLCCMNCGGDHSSRSYQCPEFIMEKEIQRINDTKDVIY